MIKNTFAWYTASATANVTTSEAKTIATTKARIEEDVQANVSLSMVTASELSDTSGNTYYVVANGTSPETYHFNQK